MDNLQISEQNYELDLEKTTNAITAQLENSPEIISISNQIDIKDPNTILKFGHETTAEISRFSDQILKTMQMTKVEDSGQLIIQLNKIMEKFDIKDFEEQKPGLLDRIFNKSKDLIEKMFAKYNTMGSEVDKVYVQLKNYENEIIQSNSMLDKMFEKNLEYYELLEKYICGGNLMMNKLNTELIPVLQEKAMTSGQQLDAIQLQSAQEALDMLSQRVYDLELAKNVSLQTMPQIRLIQKGNYYLVRKINSAFIITLPIFKQGINQAITLKRQAIQSKAMAALDEKTNELLLRNAQNTAMQSKMTAQLASSASIKIETLEETWRTIINGIEETKKIQQEASQARIAGTERLKQLQLEFESRAKNA